MPVLAGVVLALAEVPRRWLGGSLGSGAMIRARGRRLASWANGVLDRWWERKEAPQPAPELQDPNLAAFDDGVAELFREGCLQGHLHTRREPFWSPGFGNSTRWSVYLRIVWLDGSRSSLQEDYGPRWGTVVEVEAGQLEFDGSVYDVRWLPPDSAHAVREGAGDDVLYYP